MRRFNLLIGIAIFTFTIGVALVWFWLSFSKLPFGSFDSTPVKESASTSASPETQAKPLSEHVQFNFLSSEKRNVDNYISVTLQIANNSSETLYYTGYSKDWHCSYKIKRGEKVEPQGDACNCAMGLAERALLPGETAKYDVPVFLKSKTNKVQVGYDFEVGQERRKETIWTDEIVVKK